MVKTPTPINFQCECGGTAYVVSVRANGWWKTIHHGDGTIEDTDLTQMKYGPIPKTVRCEVCNKSHPNPTLNDHDD